ncbi:MAG: serine/threonine-protein kinase RsbW, partial [bacterium]
RRPPPSRAIRHARARHGAATSLRAGGYAPAAGSDWGVPKHAYIRRGVGTIAPDASGMTGALSPGHRVAIEAPDLELTLPARPENVAVARHAIGGFADVLELADQTLADVKLAVTEACTNVVVHAYPDGEGPMGVRATVDDDVLRVVVVDEGRGILPRADSPGLGLGLPLIATLAESLELGTGVREETEVRMTFRLDGPPVDGPPR